MSVNLNPIPAFLIKEMEGDNGCNFHPNKTQIDQLNNYCYKLNKQITLHELEELASGEHNDQLALVTKYPELEPIHKLLNEIFENED